MTLTLDGFLLGFGAGGIYVLICLIIGSLFIDKED